MLGEGEWPMEENGGGVCDMFKTVIKHFAPRNPNGLAHSAA